MKKTYRIKISKEYMNRIVRGDIRGIESNAPQDLRVVDLQFDINSSDIWCYIETENNDLPTWPTYDNDPIPMTNIEYRYKHGD